jgi:hypothetical protein
MSFNYYFKCVAVGDAQARTTHLLHRYTAGELNAEYIPCFENYTTIVKDVNGHDVPIGLWDTGKNFSPHVYCLLFANLTVLHA